ncbi:G-type lectin S-receptor-like serine/threonine-protein kinase SD2-5 isoform X2 [Punica granatum]|nr:G-type lectin S-receptor-like serine/threonine-protein kinase SD2-5 isoform X2 [Punica granatum]
MNWIDKDGKFLVSNDSNFAFGFITMSSDVTLFLLGIVHVGTQTVVWSANWESPVSNSDKFSFNENGDVVLYKSGTVVWSTGTGNKGVSAMEMQDSGNLVLVRSDGGTVWQSFSHPSDTLLSNQEFTEGMKLVGIGAKNPSYSLEIKSGDMLLSAGYRTPQPYWSMGKDTRKIVNKGGGQISSAKLEANSWSFYDKNKNLLWKFVFSQNTDPNATWIAVLGQDGTVSFTNLPSTGSGSVVTSPTKIPSNSCSTPKPCDPYLVCHDTNNRCSCLPALQSYTNCSSGFVSPPCSPKGLTTRLVSAGDGISYFALSFILPNIDNANLESCKSSCLSNCSCLAMFFQNSTGSCYIFDSVGAFQSSSKSSDFAAYIKVPGNGGTGTSSGGSESSKKHAAVIAVIAVSTIIVILGLIYGGFRYYKSKSKLPETPQDGSEDNFLESLTGMPVRFAYKDLQTATNNFTTKLGQGGFGSVYEGTLPEGTRLAVKKLEGIGQGKKEFRAEVCIIGSIHHHHLVRLRGFCAEGAHRLLAYEYMANGSLDKWIFRKDKGEMLNWNTRFNIALGTAKGLAYLHEDCDAKIVHCDIKPENVLLDENFLAKVSDFGLAKLMTREQSNVFTTLRGTRGYLAPEWITNYAISEKSDVYSYGMVLLEIIGGRKNFDPSETSEKSHFPSYAFKMMEEGKLRDLLDSCLTYDESDERVITAIKVALWCIQEDMALRPSMTRVVQMLEGLCPVPQPPTSSPLGGRLYSSFFKSISEEGTSSGPSDCNSDAYLSAVRLSGPR